MTLDEAVADLERDRTVVDTPPSAFSPTGEEFFEFCSGFPAAWDLDPYELPKEREAVFTQKEAAIKDWHSRVMAYAKDRPGILYYRIRPDTDWERRSPDGGWYGNIMEKPENPGVWLGYCPSFQKFTVYARFLISDKQPLPLQPDLHSDRD